ncbi:hypothetical protein NMY22_g1386 [Coprinellus aureogranulatus]|nr:hypothetical protein NMY22_g1386 [Coprinellus aureogranulatus]
MENKDNGPGVSKIGQSSSQPWPLARGCNSGASIKGGQSLSATPSLLSSPPPSASTPWRDLALLLPCSGAVGRRLNADWPSRSPWREKAADAVEGIKASTLVPLFFSSAQPKSSRPLTTPVVNSMSPLSYLTNRAQRKAFSFNVFFSLPLSMTIIVHQNPRVVLPLHDAHTLLNLCTLAYVSPPSSRLFVGLPCGVAMKALPSFHSLALRSGLGSTPSTTLRNIKVGAHNSTPIFSSIDSYTVTWPVSSRDPS